MGGRVPASAGRAGRLRQSICGPRLPAGRWSAETQEGPGVTSGNLSESPGAGRRSEPAWDGAETEVGVFSPSWPSPGTRVTTNVRCFRYKSSLSTAGPKIVSSSLGTHFASVTDQLAALPLQAEEWRAARSSLDWKGASLTPVSSSPTGSIPLSCKYILQLLPPSQPPTLLPQPSVCPSSPPPLSPTLPRTGSM